MNNRILKLTFICFSCYLLTSHIPLVKNLPIDGGYYSHYYKRFNTFFASHFFDFSLSVGKENLDAIIKRSNHWDLLWGVSYQSDGSFNYSFRYPTGDGTWLNVKSNREVTCEERLDSIKCGMDTYKIKRNMPYTSYPDFPLHPNGEFIFKEFVLNQTEILDSKGLVVKVSYHLKDVQAEWLPKALRDKVYEIGFATRLPLDKLSLSRRGEVDVYYP